MRARGPFDKLRTGGWIRTAKIAFFVALGFIRFAGESRPSSRRYPGKERRDLPLKGTMSRAVGQPFRQLGDLIYGY
jgi:hypothetical protein